MPQNIILIKRSKRKSKEQLSLATSIAVIYRNKLRSWLFLLIMSKKKLLKKKERSVS